MNTINHIHIPRCSGIYIKTHIVNDLKVKKIPYFATNHGEIFPDTFKDKKFISGHFGLTPLKYRDDLINISLVRNPVDRFLSNFVYLHSGFKGAHLEAQLENWIENSKQHNYCKTKTFKLTGNTKFARFLKGAKTEFARSRL